MPPHSPPDDSPDRSSPTTAREREWIGAIRAGDQRAFEAMFRAYYPSLCAYAGRLVRGHGSAEELVQDVLLRVWRNRERWDVSGSLAGYLFRSVRNHAVSFLRHDRLEHDWREWVALADAPPAIVGQSRPADAEVRAGELAEAIERIIATLAPRCREAYLLRRQQHLSYVEIAAIMGISPKTVEVQIGAALRALRAGLSDWLDT